jgi:hypothetical protein
MNNSIVVYRIMSEEPNVPDVNVSHALALELMKAGIIRHSLDDYEVIRQGDITVTVYSHRKA